QWLQTYSSPGNTFDGANSIAVDPAGNVYITGQSFRAGTGYDYSTVKYNANGVQQWVQIYNGPTNGTDYGNSIAVNGNGDVYVTGQSAALQSSSGYDFVTIKYSSVTGIEPVTNQIPDKFSLSQNYPNPFNPSTKIKFALPQVSFVKLIVYDILGREVKRLVNEPLSPGFYEMNFDASGFSSGVYIYKIFTDGFHDAKKMLVIK